MNKLEKNLEILRRIESYLRAYPDQRLGQALLNMGVLDCRPKDGGTGIEIRDPYHEGPEDTLARMSLVFIKSNF